MGQIPGKANHYMAVGGNAERRIIKDSTIRAYEQSFCLQCRHYKNKHIDSPFMLQVTVYYDNVRFDLDNSLKTLLDCLQYVDAITDDNLCYQILATKRIDRSRPRVEFQIKEINEHLKLF